MIDDYLNQSLKKIKLSAFNTYIYDTYVNAGALSATESVNEAVSD